MVSGVQTTVVFLCPKCGLSYQATQHRNHGRPADRFDCPGCGAEVHAWSGKYDYMDWQAFGPEALNNRRLNVGPSGARSMKL
jgi:predicted RNA-binding Zn-ribbon protein involved in translation (DUF1610 family)